jgi:hypothetical protein
VVVMKKWGVVAACAIVAAIAIYFTLGRASEEDKVRAVLNRFAKAVQVKKDDTILSRNARLKSELKELVTDDVHVDVTELNMGVTGRAKLAEDATKAGAIYAQAAVDWSNLAIKVEDATTTAKVDGTCVVTATSGTEKKIDKREVHLLLRKDDGTWRITTIDVAAPRNE